uniref:Uncharacterized protein n=1 Tax=Cacopsylla melanoneura TaxID=428564 RepID=A0A8D9BK05_9HEMI
MHSKLVKLLDARFNLFTAFVHFSYCKREGLTVLNTVMTGVTVPCQGPRAQLSSFQGSAVTDDFSFFLEKISPRPSKKCHSCNNITRRTYNPKQKLFVFSTEAKWGPEACPEF